LPSRQLEKIRVNELQDVATSAKKKGAAGSSTARNSSCSMARPRYLDRHRAHQRRPARGERRRRVPGARRRQGRAKKAYPTQDGQHAADITFTGVEVGASAAIGDPEDSLALIERVVDEARTAMCAEAVGLMDESLKETVEYLKTRKQFGVPIGSFQTLQHRAADMFVAVEQARSMSMFATMASDFDDARERATAVAAAKVQVGKSAKFVGQQAIQLHGGIGMTMEPGSATTSSG